MRGFASTYAFSTKATKTKTITTPFIQGLDHSLSLNLRAQSQKANPSHLGRAGAGHRVVCASSKADSLKNAAEKETLSAGRPKASRMSSLNSSTKHTPWPRKGQQEFTTHAPFSAVDDFSVRRQVPVICSNCSSVWQLKALRGWFHAGPRRVRSRYAGLVRATKAARFWIRPP